MIRPANAFAPSLLLTALLAGCAGSPEKPAEPTDTTPDTEVQTPAQVQAFMLRGQVVLSADNRYIQPCNSQQQYWLTLPDKNLPAADALASRYGQPPLYGEFIGYLEPAADEGREADFDARFVVKQLNLLSAEVADGCQQRPQTTRAFGNEPFWMAEVQADRISLTQPGQATEQQAITSRDIRSGHQVYQGTDSKLTMNQAQCNDTMSDSLYGWQSTLSWKGRKYQGCATLGARDVTLTWSGTYQGTTYLGEEPTLTTTLELKPDHSAVTRYTYPSGEPGLQERGFWQQAGEGKVKVTMAQYQGRRLISERVFVRDGEQLSANEETINGETYFLGDSGLTLRKQPAPQ